MNANMRESGYVAATVTARGLMGVPSEGHHVSSEATSANTRKRKGEV